MDDNGNQWVNVEHRLPESKEGMWSKEVIALTDTGDVNDG